MRSNSRFRLWGVVHLRVMFGPPWYNELSWSHEDVWNNQPDQCDGGLLTQDQMSWGDLSFK